MSALEYAEEVKANIERIAKESGDEVLHSWIFDLQDGTYNVKAIIRFKEGGSGTVGWNIHD